MSRLLSLVDLVCGRPARHRVFEPMLADWQRELTDTRGTGPRFGVTLKGAAAFARALALCAVTEGLWMPPAAGVLRSMIGIALAVSAAIGIVMIAPPSLTLVPRNLSEPLVQRYLLSMSGLIAPPAFLLGLYAMRCDARVTWRHAVLATTIGTVAMIGLALITTRDALERRYNTFEVHEHMREISLALHQSGRLVYSGSSYQRELASTAAERRERFDRFRARIAEFRKQPPPTWSSRFAQFRPVLLAIVFAVIGWTLGGFGTATIPRGFAWWSLVFAAIVTMTNLLALIVRIPMPRLPQWTILPIFASIMLALVIGGRVTRLTLSKRSS